MDIIGDRQLLGKLCSKFIDKTNSYALKEPTIPDHYLEPKGTTALSISTRETLTSLIWSEIQTILLRKWTGCGWTGEREINLGELLQQNLHWVDQICPGHSRLPS